MVKGADGTETICFPEIPSQELREREGERTECRGAIREGVAVAAPGVLRPEAAVRIRGAVRRAVAAAVAAEGRSLRTLRICCAAARTA